MDAGEIRVALTRIFREVIENESLELRDDMSAQDIPEWDSYVHIVLITAIEREFGVRFSGEEVQALGTIGDMLRLIAAKDGREDPDS